jgi:alkyl hydroperoxide reductase subunit F
LEVDGTFVEMGLTANTAIVEGLVDLDAQGRIVIDSANRTSQAGIFAAGDVTNTYAEQVLVAVGEGA